MDLDELEATLEASVLSPYQAKVYVTLLEMQDATATKIVDACAVPQPRIYDVLRELEKKDYVETYEGESIRARAHDPSDVITQLEQKADRLSAAAKTVEGVWERPPIEDNKINVFGGFQSVIDNAGAGIRSANYSIQIAATTSTFFDLQSALKEAYERGVIVKLSLYIDPEERRSVEGLQKYFEETATEVRYRETPGPFLALVDGDETYFALKRQSAHSYGMLVNDQALSAMLYWYFQNALWEHWEVVHSDRDGGYPRKYIEIRECTADLAPKLEEGETATVTVHGYDSTTDEECTIRGEVIETITPENFSTDTDFHTRYTGQVSLVLDTGDACYTVGGSGAIIEDIQAAKLIVHNPDT